MFTGIIRHIGTVTCASATVVGRRIVIDTGSLAERLGRGDSVCVSGVCLTAVELDGSRAAFDVVPETLNRSSLGSLCHGAKVNLEPSLRLGDALDGHMVQGHVDGIAQLLHVGLDGGQCRLEFTVAEAITDEMVVKGSVAVDGVSLTLAEVARGRFSVAIIPTTLEMTTLKRLRPGAKVNIETDMIGKYVRRQMGFIAGGLTMDKLREGGFA